MAFVFQNPRWTDKKNINQHLGPGTYDYDINLNNRKQRFGYISPQKRVIQACQTPNRQKYLYIQDKIEKQNNDEKRQAIRLMHLKNKIKKKSQSKVVTQMEKQNIEQFKGFIKSMTEVPKIHSQATSKRHQGINRKKQILQIINKQKCIPSLCKDFHEGLCITNKQLRKCSIKQIPFNKINYKHFNSRTITKHEIQTDQYDGNLTIGQSRQIPTKNSKNSQRLIMRTAEKKTRQCLKKKIQIVKELCNAYDQKPTGISDDSQDSIQFIQNSTPGPGSYNPYPNQAKNNNFKEKFGVTVQRFPKQKIIPYKYNLDINKPNFRKQSKASQRLVAFGTSTQNKQNYHQGSQQITYLEDYNSIQYKSFKNLIKNYHNPGFFLSKNIRFPSNKQINYYGPDFFPQQGNNKLQHHYLAKPQFSFLSKVQRLHPINQLTANVEFTGQQYKTIKNSIIQQTEIDRQPPPFLSDSPRFISPQALNDAYLINSLKPQVKKQSSKGFTFKKSEQIHKSASTTPFAKYQISKQWVKPSFNIKFQAFEQS